MMKGLLTVLIVLLGVLQGSAIADDDISSLGRKVAPFTLRDFRAQPVSSADYDDNALVVVCFLGAVCPLTKFYGVRLQAMSDQFRSQGVAFLGINSNVQDSLSDIRNYSRTHNITFPILKDEANHVADAFGATRTPQVFVL